MLIPLVSLALAAAPAAVSQGKPAPIDAAMVTQHRSWIDDQARWNAQHMAAARRLETVAAALRRHDTSFDRHGSELRDHERTSLPMAMARTTRAGIWRWPPPMPRPPRATAG